LIRFVAPDAVRHQANLLDMAAPGDLLVAKVRENYIEVGVQVSREIHAKASASVSRDRKSEPVLLYLFETVPVSEVAIVNDAGGGTIAEENETIDDRFVHLDVFWAVAVKKQKRGR
jgi:hypothetical protein